MNGLSLFTSITQKVASVFLVAWLTVPQLVLASAIIPQTIIDLTNAKRTDNRQTALSVNTELTMAAYTKAQDMIDHGYFDHYGPQGQTPWQYILSQGYDYQSAGENLAIDFQAAEDLIDAWLKSATHRDNILDPDYQDIGVAVLDGVFDGHQTTLVVQMFGAKQPTLLGPLTSKVDLVEYVGQLLGINEP